MNTQPVLVSIDNWQGLLTIDTVNGNAMREFYTRL